MGAASAGLEAKLTSTKTQLEDALARVAQLETLSTQQGDMIEAFKVRITLMLVNPKNVAKPKFANSLFMCQDEHENEHEHESFGSLWCIFNIKGDERTCTSSLDRTNESNFTNKIH